LYLTLKKNVNESVWNNFKISKINQLDLHFNHIKNYETKILTEKKYSSKLDTNLTDLGNVLLTTLNDYKSKCIANKNDIYSFFRYGALAWVSSNSTVNLSEINYPYPNIFKNNVSDNSVTLIKNIIEDNDKRASNGGSDKFSILTLDQMKEMYKLSPIICNSSNYIIYYLRKLLPKEPRDLKIDSEEFKELEEFSKMMSDSIYHSDLKYLVLYLKLKNAVVQKLPYNEDDFME